MDHRWRPVPAPLGNICPMCSHSHFPLCPPYPPPPLPPPPYNENPRFPSQPEYPRPDPYHMAPPNPYAPNPYDGWHNQNDHGHREGFGQAMYDYSSSTSNGYVGEFDRNHKRPRLEEFGSGVFGQENNLQNPARFSLDDERRLKLIRDHGGASLENFTNLQHNSERSHQDFDTNFVRNVEINNHTSNNNNNMYSPFQPNAPNHLNLHQNPINDYDSMPAKGSRYYSHMNNNWERPEHQPHMGPDLESPSFLEREAYLPRHENRVFAGQPTPPPPPPLPSSPPPPLPVEPPVVHSHSSQPKLPLFPVPVSSSVTNPYLHNKPLPHTHASTGFVSEVFAAFLCTWFRFCSSFLLTVMLVLWALSIAFVNFT